MAAVGRRATIRVRGEAAVRAEPDEAILWITLSALEDSPGPALADVSARSRALQTLLDELGVANVDRSTTGITVHEEFDHTASGRRSLGHRASTAVSVRVTDPEVLGGLVARAAEELAAHVAGPRWQIAPDNPARLQAAREAAVDAVRKARAYAEGVGAMLGRPLRLTEPEGRPMMIRTASRGSPEPLPIEPGEDEVTASILVTFALEPEASA